VYIPMIKGHIDDDSTIQCICCVVGVRVGPIYIVTGFSRNYNIHSSRSIGGQPVACSVRVRATMYFSLDSLGRC
jgi:hypothetical protein